MFITEIFLYTLLQGSEIERSRYGAAIERVGSKACIKLLRGLKWEFSGKKLNAAATSESTESWRYL